MDYNSRDLFVFRCGEREVTHYLGKRKHSLAVYATDGDDGMRGDRFSFSLANASWRLSLARFTLSEPRSCPLRMLPFLEAGLIGRELSTAQRPTDEELHG